MSEIEFVRRENHVSGFHRSVLEFAAKTDVPLLKSLMVSINYLKIRNDHSYSVVSIIC